MADVIYKYGPFVGNLPVEFKGNPLYVGTHVEDEIYLWCRLNTGREFATRKARLVYTGEEYTGVYIGTVISRTGFVYHAIEG